MAPRSPESGLAVGEALPGWRAPPAPVRRAAAGHWCALEPLEPARHAKELHEAFSTDREDRMWTYLAYGPFASVSDYRAWLDERALGADPLFFAIRARDSGLAVGVGAYLRIDPPHGVIEIGHLAFSPLLQRRPAATEAVYLLLRQAFTLGYRRCEWKCDALNAASNRAARRLGFRFEGVFRQATVCKGRNRDTAWYSILDREWPARDAALRAWLDPGNFDPEGRQRRRLSALTAPAERQPDGASQALYTLFWQPGCTSCLKLREFLRSRGVDFESVNVLEAAGAAGRLEALGVRSVPVLARGTQFVLGQDLDEVARFVGVPLERMRLAEPELARRLERLLGLAARYAGQLPADALRSTLPDGRRNGLDLACHIAQVAAAFLDASAGGRLTFEHFERRAPEWMTDGVDAAAALGHAAAAIASWGGRLGAGAPEWLDTYHGRQPRHAVLERTTWHVAQHLRQLVNLLERWGVEPGPPPGDELFTGLPLPGPVWDVEEPQ